MDVQVRGDTVRVTFTVTNAATSTDSMVGFTIDAPTTAIRVEAPGPRQGWATSKSYANRSVAGWDLLRKQLTPGSTTPTLAFEAVGLPGLVQYWGEPLAEPDSVEAIDERGIRPVPPAGPDGWPDVATGTTLGVVAFPPDRSTAALTSRLLQLVDDACARGWIDNRGVCTSLRVKVTEREFRALANELDAQRGKHVNDLAYYLLRANAEVLLQRS